MGIEKYKDIILGWFKQWFDANYRAGVPRTPPHTHNGIDNLPVANVVTKIVAGTGVTLTPTGGQGTVTISGSGGSPGGVDTNVQFNDSSAFGGSSQFTWDKTNHILTLDDASGGGFVGGDIMTGGISDLNIRTENKSASGATTGVLFLSTGNVTGNGGSKSGDIQIQAGNGTGASGTRDAHGGNVNIYSGRTRSNNSGGGSIHLSTTISTSTGTNTNCGDIVLDAGNSVISNRGMVQIISNLIITQTGNSTNADVITSGAKGCIIFDLCTAPTANVGNGVLYIDGSGTLTFRGGSGTVTPLAIA